MLNSILVTFAKKIVVSPWFVCQFDVCHQNFSEIHGWIFMKFLEVVVVAIRNN